MPFSWSVDDRVARVTVAVRPADDEPAGVAPETPSPHAEYTTTTMRAVTMRKVTIAAPALRASGR